MTDADALLAAALASPDDHSLKLVWLDCLEESGERPDFVRACREFLAKCGERRKYETKDRMVHAVGAFGHVVKNARRALPGWRDWLGDNPNDGGYSYITEHTKTWIRSGALPVGWLRLLPSLLAITTSNDRWQRQGATIALVRGIPDHNRVYVERWHRARLTFARGFLERVEFRDWQSADALLSAILADQPFVECGIRGAVRVEPTRDYRQIGGGRITSWVLPHSKGGTAQHAIVSYETCGPAWASIEADMRCLGGENTKVFPALANNDALARARHALSAALRKRALAGVGAPALEVAR